MTTTIATPIGPRLPPHPKRRPDQPSAPHADTAAARPRWQAARTHGRPPGGPAPRAERSLHRRHPSRADACRLNAISVGCRVLMSDDLKKRVVLIGADDEPNPQLVRASINDQAGY